MEAKEQGDGDGDSDGDSDGDDSEEEERPMHKQVKPIAKPGAAIRLGAGFFSDM